MTWKMFYQLTEIFTTPLDVMWLILAFSYSYFYYGAFNWAFTVPAFIVVFLFHLIINMQNNYMDYKNASDEGIYKTEISTIGRNNMDMTVIRKLLIGMSTIAGVIGLVLAFFTGLPTLIIGSIASILGFSYSAGPKPLNSTIFCEIAVSIPIAICIPATYLYLGSIGEWTFDAVAVGKLILITMVPAIIWFILQLSNNTCDLEQDLQNGRKTLVSYIGIPRAIKVFQTGFWLSGLMIILLVVLKLAPVVTLFAFLLYPFVWKKISVFFTNQNKREVYMVLVKNNSLIVMIYIALFALGSLISNL